MNFAETRCDAKHLIPLCYGAMANIQGQKILYVGLRINRKKTNKQKNTSRDTFWVIMLNGPTVGLCLGKIAWNNTKMCLEVMFWSHDSFAEFPKAITFK